MFTILLSTVVSDSKIIYYLKKTEILFMCSNFSGRFNRFVLLDLFLELS